MKRSLAVLALMLAPVLAHACPVCFGAPGSPMSKASDNAILFLLVVVGLVQFGFVALFWTFWRRAKAMRRFREQFHVIDGGLS